MDFQNILIPTDGSEFTKAAIEAGLALAELSGGKVTVLYVMDQSVYSNMPMDAAVVNIHDTLTEEGDEATEYVVQRGREKGIDVTSKIIEGIPSKVIVQESSGYDIIVMGTLAKKGMTKILMGSVAEKVVEGAECSVMVVRTVTGSE